MKLGFLSLGDLTSNPHTRETPSARRRLAEILDAAELTEQLGLDAFSVGEHHSARWAITSPPVLLAAMAERTSRIRLRSGVTLVGSLDAVRIAEDYATVDLLSDGRLDLTAGKGNFPQPFPLFGHDPEEVRDRLAEGIDLLLQIWSGDPVTWSGRYRPPLTAASIGPRPLQDPPPIWCGVATSPESVEFAAERGLPIFLGGVIQSREHYGALADHYRLRAEAAGFDARALPVGSASHLYIRKDGAQARREFETYYRHAMTETSREMGRVLPPLDFEDRLAGPLVCGSPSEAIEKILWFHERYGHDLHLFHADLGGVPAREVAETMELFASEVAPAVRAATAKPDRRGQASPARNDSTVSA